MFQKVLMPLTEHLKMGLSSESRLEMVLWNFLIVQIFLNTTSEATGTSTSSWMVPTSNSSNSFPLPFFGLFGLVGMIFSLEQ